MKKDTHKDLRNSSSRILKICQGEALNLRRQEMIKARLKICIDTDSKVEDKTVRLHFAVMFQGEEGNEDLDPRIH